MTEQQAAIKRCLQRHPDWNNQRVAKSIPNSTSAQVNEVRVELGMPIPPAYDSSRRMAVAMIPRKKSHTLSRDQFAAQYDRNTRLRKAIEKGIATLVNPDEILNEATFRIERCGNPPSGGWRDIASEPQFRKYQFIAGGQVHWAAPSTKKWAIETVQGARDL